MSRPRPDQRPPASREGQHRTLGVVQHLGLVGVAEPGHDRRVVLGGHLLDDHVGGRAVGRREREGLHVARARPPGTLGEDTDAAPVVGVVGEPAAHLARGEPGHVEGEAGVVDVLLGLERLEEPVAQHPELEPVEQRVHLLAVPRLHREVGRLQRQVEVEDQRVELTVADHVVEVLAQALPRLALDVLGLVDDVGRARRRSGSTWPRSWGRRPARRAGCRTTRRPALRARGSGTAARRTSPPRRPASSASSPRRPASGR